MSIFTNLWSWSFLAGLVAGFVLNRAIALVRVCWLERHRPLPDGRRRSKWQALAFDRRWLVGLLAIAFLGWSVITTSENASDVSNLSRRVADCQARLIVAITDSRKVTAENEKISADNDRLSQEERQLLADLARYQAEWLGRILDPPAEVKALERGSPVRERYNLDVTRGFFNRAAEVNRRIDAIHVEQDQNKRDRPKSRPVLPDPSCADRRRAPRR